MSNPSDQAVEAAEQLTNLDAYGLRSDHAASLAFAALEAAHNLGLDRSVCLRDVVEKVRWHHPRLSIFRRDDERVADFIEREFGGGS